MNPDRVDFADAGALDQRLKTQSAGNYIGMRIVRDPDPRFAFQFRRDAAATLARFISDSRFVAAEGGIPREELQPLFDEWWKRFEPHRILPAVVLLAALNGRLVLRDGCFRMQGDGGEEPLVLFGRDAELEPDGTATWS